MTLRKEFGHLFAKSAFAKVGGEEAIIGKFGSIVRLEDGTFDYWIVGRDEPLSNRKLANTIAKLPENVGVEKLDGEAYGNFRGLGTLVRVARVLGVRKKPKVSAAHRAASAQRLRQLRA